MKWSIGKLSKLSREELIAILDRVDGLETIYSTISKRELVNRVINNINKGLIK